MDDLVIRAEGIARAAHDGQVDKAGMPYAEHPARVAARCAPDPAAMAAGWLHDVLEDTEVTAQTLVAHGIPVALGADDPLLFGTRLVAQYGLARTAHDFTDDELADLARASFAGSRAPDSVLRAAARDIAAWLAHSDPA